MEILDIVVVVGYFFFCLVIGLLGMRKVKNIRDYAIGNGTFTGGMVGATLLATHIGAGSTVGVVEEIASVGIIFGIGMFIQPFMWLLMSWIFVPRIEQFKNAGCISFGDIMQQLYGPGARQISDICILFVSIATVSGQLIAVGYLFHTFFGISIFEGALLGFGAVVLYSFAGGVRSVVFTDVFQALVLFVALPIICFASYYDVGGLNGILSKVPASHLKIEFTVKNVVALISVFMWMMLGSAAVFVQRFLMARDKEQLKSALHGVFIASFPLCVMFFIIGFVLRAKMDSTSGMGLYQIIDQYVPAGLKGVISAGLMAAVMSTTDSWLNTGSVVCGREIGRRFKVDELIAARVSLIGLSILSVVVAFYAPQNLVLIDMIASNFWSPMMYAPIVAGFLGFSFSVRSFWAGLTSGILGAFLGAYCTARLNDTRDLLTFSGVSEITGTILCALGMLTVYVAEGRLTFDVRTILSQFKNWISCIYYRYLLPHFSLPTLKVFFEYQQSDRWRYYFLGIFGIMYFLLSSLAFMNFEDTSRSMITILRITSLLICFILLVHEIYLPPKSQKYIIPPLWYFSLIYCLPFLSSYTVMVTNYDVLWLINFMVSIAMFYILETNRITLWGTVLGIFAARLIFSFTGYTVISEAGSYGSILLFIYIIFILSIVYALYIDKEEKTNEMKSMLLYGQAMAHELLQPLAGAYMLAESMVKAYNDKEATKPEEIERLTKWATLILDVCKRGIRSVQMILSALRGDIKKASDVGTYKIADCLREAITEYGLVDTEKVKLKVLIYKSQDFDFHASKYFIKQVINNLLHNGFKYAGRKATIRIWWRDGMLHIKDNGVGIPKHVLPHLFKRFQNIGGSLSGSGVGLAFAKKVMESFGGSIRCESEEGKYTLFTLSFPPVATKSLEQCS